MKTVSSYLVRASLLTIGLTAAACTQEAAAPTPSTLGDVQVPGNFTFATTKAVALSVSASADKIGASQGALAVERADGKVLYRGPIEASKPLAVKLMIPSKDDELRLRLYAKSGELTASAPIASGEATYKFE